MQVVGNVSHQGVRTNQTDRLVVESHVGAHQAHPSRAPLSTEVRASFCDRSIGLPNNCQEITAKREDVDEVA